MPKSKQRKEMSALAKEKGTAERALTNCRSSKDSAGRKGSQFSNKEVRAKGQLSGHLQSVDCRKIRPKGSESVSKKYGANERDR